MTRVVSLFLPQLAIERLRRSERLNALPKQASPDLARESSDTNSSARRGDSRRTDVCGTQNDNPRAVASRLCQPSPEQTIEDKFPIVRRSLREHRAQSSQGIAQPAVQMVPATPLVLVVPIAQRQLITAACPAALALGLKPGMAATQAHAMIANLDVRAADSDADQAMLSRLALHAILHWTPVAAATSDGLVLDLTGTTHLFGGEERFCRRVHGFCARLGLTARIAVADTIGVAHAMARFGQEPVAIVPAGGEIAAIAPLPLAALRIEAEVVAAAGRLGLERIADLLPMPRGPLTRRLGFAIVERLDQAIGRIVEPIVSVVQVQAPAAERRVLEPIATAEAIATMVGDLVNDLVAVLQSRGLGARTVELTAIRVDTIDQRLVIGASRATRDARHLTRMFALRLDQLDPGLGIEAMRIVATRAEPLGAVALGTMLAGEDNRVDLAATIDRLTGRAGDAAVFRLTPVESDVPERAVRRVGALDEVGMWPRWRRPVRLLASPESLQRVIALFPDAPPRRFTWRGEMHVVVAGDGPERIYGEWWRRDGELYAVRDYYSVEAESGGRFWVFRRGDGVMSDTGDLSWWMHGLFG